MEGPFTNSISTTEKCKKLQDVVSPEDTVAILINADPDSIASAFALKRLFWRKVKKVNVVRINKTEWADNLAFINCLYRPIFGFCHTISPPADPHNND
jgi:nanoRNase/pAp phosphatase (c-di-AMP/oligoRNAs hydrolase)